MPHADRSRWRDHCAGVAAALMLVVFIASPVRASSPPGIPYAPYSTCPPAVSVTPDGSAWTDVIVHNTANLPISGSDVRIIFNCTPAFCWNQPNNGNSVDLFTDGTGAAHFLICGVAADTCGASIYADGVFLCQATLHTVGVGDEPPPAFGLRASPNPFRSAVQVSYALPRAGSVRLTVHDVAGRRWMTLVDAVQPAGEYRQVLRSTDAPGGRLPPGVYMVRLACDGLVRTTRVVLKQ